MGESNLIGDNLANMLNESVSSIDKNMQLPPPPLKSIMKKRSGHSRPIRMGPVQVPIQAPAPVQVSAPDPVPIPAALTLSSFVLFGYPIDKKYVYIVLAVIIAAIVYYLYKNKNWFGQKDDDSLDLDEEDQKNMYNAEMARRYHLLQQEMATKSAQQQQVAPTCAPPNPQTTAPTQPTAPQNPGPPKYPPLDDEFNRIPTYERS